MASRFQKVRKFVPHVLVFLFIAVVAQWTINRYMRLASLSLLTKASQEKKFMTAWEDDLGRLDRAKALPQGFKDLRKIRFITQSEKLKIAFKKYPLSLTKNNKGKFNLEIFADNIEGGGVVIQYDLIEVKSGNTVWELGRTFPQNINR